MRLNTAQMLDRIDLYLDRIKSPRFDFLSKIDALHIAQDEIMADRYDNFKKHRGISFQAIQRVRDELRTMVQDEETQSISQDVVTVPTTYRYGLNVVVTVDGITRQCSPITHDEEELIKIDPFDYPSVVEPRKPYWIETSSGIRVLHGGSSFTSAKISYLKIPTLLCDLVQRDSTYSFTDQDLVYVFSGVCTYNSKDYNEGDTFTITTANGLSFTGSGIGIRLNSCSFPETLHDEICKIAASILSGSTDDFEKKKVIDIENERS